MMQSISVFLGVIASLELSTSTSFSSASSVSAVSIRRAQAHGRKSGIHAENRDYDVAVERLLLEYPNCNVTRLDYIGDGQCDLISNYNTAACGWDGGDCCETTCNGDCPLTRMECQDPKVLFYSKCTDQLIASLGDGFCDFNEQNTYECGWDGGDCCEASCQPGLFYTCNETEAPFQCKDPQFVTPTKSPTKDPSSSIASKAPTKQPITPMQLPSSSTPTEQPFTSMPTAQPTPTLKTSNPTMQPVTPKPTKATTPLPTNSENSSPSPTSITNPTPIRTTSFLMTPFFLYLSIPVSSNVTTQDINLVEFYDVTNTFLNKYFKELVKPSVYGMNFDHVTLSNNMKGTTVEQHRMSSSNTRTLLLRRGRRRRRLQGSTEELTKNNDTFRIFRPYLDGVAYFSLDESWSNDTDGTFPNYQQNLLTNLTTSAFTSNDQVNEYNNALRASSDSIVSQMTLKAFSYEDKTYDQIVNSNNNNSTYSGNEPRLSSKQITILYAVGGAILALIIIGVAYFFSHRCRDPNRGQEQKVDEHIGTSTPTSSPSRTKKDINITPSRGFVDEDNESHDLEHNSHPQHERVEDESLSTEVTESPPPVVVDQKQNFRVMGVMGFPFRKPLTSSDDYIYETPKAPVRTTSCDGSHDSSQNIIYSYSVDDQYIVQRSAPASPYNVVPQKLTDIEEISTSEEILPKSSESVTSRSINSTSTCTADVVELEAAIRRLNAKVTKLEVDYDDAKDAIYFKEDQNSSGDSVADTVGALKSLDSATTIESRVIRPLHSVEGRGCASVETNPYSMKGRQIILPNKSFDSQASTLSTPFSVVDMKTKDTFRTKKTALTSPVSAATHTVDGCNMLIETNVLRTISSDTSESTEATEQPLGPPHIHRAIGDSSISHSLEFGNSFDTQDSDAGGCGELLPYQLSSANSCVTIKMANSYDRLDVVSAIVEDKSTGIPTNIDIVLGDVTNDAGNTLIDKRRSANSIFQSLRNLNNLKPGRRHNGAIPPPPPSVPPPPPVEVDIRPIRRVNSNSQEEELFHVVERNGSFEVDDNKMEDHRVTHPTGTTQLISSSEYQNHPYSDIFADRRLKSKSMLRPKPLSQVAGDPRSKRRFERRNKKRCPSVVHEGDFEEDSCDDLSSQAVSNYLMPAKTNGTATRLDAILDESAHAPTVAIDKFRRHEHVSAEVV